MVVRSLNGNGSVRSDPRDGLKRGFGGAIPPIGPCQISAR